MTKKEKVETIITSLDKLYPSPKCELNYTKDYELLLSVMLSAQTTDKRVNEVTAELYKKYDTLEKLDKLDILELERIIRPIGMYKEKAKNFKGVVKGIIELGGQVPNDREKLIKLPGIGRKTINVVLSNLFNEPCFAVDTHVNRVSKRLGLANINDDVLKVEEKLMKAFPKDHWSKSHHQFVLFGRYNCTAKKPACEKCPFIEFCKESNKNLVK